MKRLTVMLISILALFSLTFSAWGLVLESSYADLSGDEWYSPRVENLRERGIMVGVGDNCFAPDAVFTRSQLAVVLYRLAGCPAVVGDDSFYDTMPGQWYSDAVIWAAQNGVVEGYDNGFFGVEDPVTQETLALMLWRCAGSYVLGDEYASVDGVENLASPWAVDAVRWARVDGLLTGEVPFVPGQPITRSQTADMVQRFLLLLAHFAQVDAVSSATRQTSETVQAADQVQTAEGAAVETETPVVNETQTVEAVAPETETAEAVAPETETPVVSEAQTPAETETAPAAEEGSEKKLLLFIGETQVPVTWENNYSVKTLQDLQPLTIQTTLHGGYEQVGTLTQNIPASENLFTAVCGDIILRDGNQFSIFCSNNFWRYTKLGHIDLPQEELLSLLNQESLTITLTME